MVFRKVDRKLLASADWQLIIAMLSICLLGLAVLHSAGFDHETGRSQPMIKQATAMAIGLAAFVGCMLTRTSFWRNTALLWYLVGCGLLAMILVTGVVAGGARRWLDIGGGFRLQPSEFMKVGMILLLAKVCSRENAPKKSYTLSTLMLPAVIILIPAVLIIEQPDLGTALSHLMIGGSMLFVVGVRWGTAIRLIIFSLVLVIPAWNFVLKDYQKQRVLTFLSPESDPLGSGYHAIQSKIAVGSGAVTGKGFLRGTQTQLRFLPEQTTDFIFSVLAEEGGFIASLTLLLLYAWLIIRVMNIASRCGDSFSAFVSVGVASLIFWHVVVNIGMVIGVLPVVGITLALLSYGGSSVLSVMAALGIVAGFSFRRSMFAPK